MKLSQSVRHTVMTVLFFKENRQNIGGEVTSVEALLMDTRKRTALLTTAFTESRLNSHTNAVFTHSRKRKRPLTL